MNLNTERVRSLNDELRVRLINEVCCFAGSFDLLKDTRDEKLCAAIERRDSAVLFDRLTFSF